MPDDFNPFESRPAEPTGEDLAWTGDEESTEEVARQKTLLPEEDVEEETGHFVETFSLLANLVREDFRTPRVATRPHPVVEIIRYGNQRQVLGYDQVRRGGSHRPGRGLLPLLRFDRRDSCRLIFSGRHTGGVIRAGRTTALDDLKNPARLVAKQGGEQAYTIRIEPGDYANLRGREGGAFVRFVHPPVIPRTRTRRKLDRTHLSMLGTAFAFHLALILVFGALSPRVQASAECDIDRFTRVDIADIPMTANEPDPEVPPVPLVQPQQPDDPPMTPPPETKKPDKIRHSSKTRTSTRPGKGSGKGKPPGGGNGGGPGMMAALGKLKKSKTAGMVATAATNLDAVRVPGHGAGFKVSGPVTKLPTSKLIASPGKGVGVRTGLELLQGGKGKGGKGGFGFGPGRLDGGKTGTRGVGAVVFDTPQRRIRKKGRLSKEAIARVVRQHTREIQHCYEKSLLRDNRLKGKIILEWTIATTGRVTLVRTRFNSLHAPQVAMCVSARIRAWTFPRPQGGFVVVEYPFIFDSVGF